MKGIKGVSEINDRRGKVILSKYFFAELPVLSAISKFTNQYYVGVVPVNANEFEVTIQAKQIDSKPDKDVLKKFCNELVDEQIRYDLDKQFGRLREIIVEEAFSPIKNK